jgi:hypothetical protein
MTKLQQITEIHESMENGQIKQAVEQMQSYCSMYDFLVDYDIFLVNNYINQSEIKEYILKATKSYFRITNR